MRRYDAIRIGLPFAASLFLAFLSTSAVLTGCHVIANGEGPAGDSFFPLARGNQWVYAWFDRGREMGRDTVSIDMMAQIDGVKYFRVNAPWPGFGGGLLVRRDAKGNLIWDSHPDTSNRALLKPYAKVGERWATGFANQPCADTFAMSDDYAVVATPYGLFDGAKQIGAVNRCADYGWGISLARGIGPVSWVNIGFAGTRTWLLVSADIHDDPTNPSASSRVVDGN